MPVRKTKDQKPKIKTATKNSKIVTESEGSKKEISKRSTGLKINVVNLKGKAAGTLNLPKEIFGLTPNDKLLAQAVRVYRANQREGSAHTKSRGEVRGSTRKIYRQKGTGRARHGAVKAPIFVGGGVAFGPKKRDYSLNFPKKMRRKALFMALSSKLKDGEVLVVSGFEKIEPKTKNVASAFKNLKIEDNKILFVLPSNLGNVRKAARNIEGVNVTPANLINTYEVLASKTLLLMKDSIETMKSTFLKEGK